MYKKQSSCRRTIAVEVGFVTFTQQAQTAMKVNGRIDGRSVHVSIAQERRERPNNHNFRGNRGGNRDYNRDQDRF